ncbi:MAG: thioredoxin-dependent thiol peroxidase [Candidatus Magasanikbacteria bacterium CG10_big_fil_rev_8_21_14_0_10_43_6]|uniref:thioredoxin-dependent peroxiredoxin n=1 Tax=Candidatus Magasanikbacteria bacterium CG10_big_fil_rev_8_21_14_0_10_43_6 TaxID=1974650 RepID=A0A2M6W151_9BACT|nr:MAG: thioredoxin-dependent thiol peroxidase [Candidatus Magasanikbacteria bacterium CG10_big_fil_rev_8_21_14_0_10_43_6]
MKILEGKKAPDFSLPDQDQVLRSLGDYAGQKVLLYFYPKDNTPGCTTEACNFRDRLNELQAHGVQVLGVSKDTSTSHKKFSQKFDLNFPLLADIHTEVMKAYGVWVEKSMFGKKYMGTQRDSFLIDEQGVVVKHYVKVPSGSHVDDVLKDLENMSHA